MALLLEMKILVTGAAGFIGYHVASKLLARGDTVVGLDNLNPYYSVRLKEERLANLQKHSRFQFLRADLEDSAAVAHAFTHGPFGAVIHLAAQAGVRYSLERPELYIKSNVMGFLNILEACRHNSIPHLLYASSSSVYGLNAKSPFSTADQVDHPVSLYAATKKSNELMAHVYSHLFRLPTTGLRFFTVYGPWGRPDMAYFKFTKAILEGREIEVFNEGRLLRDFTYVDDVTEGIIKLLPLAPSPAPTGDGTSAPYRVFNIGNNRPIPLMEFVGTLEKILGKKAAVKFMPMQPGDVLATAADIEPLRQAIGFVPTTTIETGLTRFVEWYRQGNWQ